MLLTYMAMANILTKSGNHTKNDNYSGNVFYVTIELNHTK